MWGAASTPEYEGNSSPVPSTSVPVAFTAVFAAMVAVFAAIFLVRAGCMVYQDRKHPESVLVRESFIVGVNFLLGALKRIASDAAEQRAGRATIFSPKQNIMPPCR